MLAAVCTSYSAAPNSEAVTVLPSFPLVALKNKVVQVEVQDLRPDASTANDWCVNEPKT